MFLEQEQGDAAFAKLMSAPVSAPRKRIRKAAVEVEASVSCAGKSLADILGKRLRAASILAKPLPTYRQWLGRILNTEDATREDMRARAEWTAINAAVKAHPFIARVVNGEWPASVKAHNAIWAMIGAAIPVMPAVERKPTQRKSRSSWPSYRAQQIAAIYATEGIAGLLSVGAVEEIEVMAVTEQLQEAA